MSRQDEIKRELTRHNQRLQILKEKKATYGLETPVSILTEIPDIEREIEALQAELAQLQQVDEQPSGVFVLKSTLTPELFGDFSVAHPKNDETLPLDESQTGMLEGHIPRELGQTATIDVEVYKLPERQSILQTGRLRLSTVRGLWSYAPVNFAGEGHYEIIVSISAGGDQDFHSINVACLEKAEVYRNTIERDREQRGASSLVLATPGDVPLDQVKQDLYQLHKQFDDFYPHDLKGAQENIYRTLDVLDPVLPLYPNDPYLQNIRAYTFKNYGMAMRDLNNPEEFDRALKEAERMFEAIRQQNPEDASAWNGLGSIALLRNDPEKALDYIETALELKPDYQEAIIDRNTAWKMLENE